MTEILILARHHVRFGTEVEELRVFVLSHSLNISREEILACELVAARKVIHSLEIHQIP